MAMADRVRGIFLQHARFLSIASRPASSLKLSGRSFFSTGDTVAPRSGGSGYWEGSATEDNGPTLAFDRSGLARSAEHSHVGLSRHEESAMAKHIKTLIRFRGGPITVAEYMEEILTNPQAGFYMHRDVFGMGGDFVTSPDISQMFGEMLGVWSTCLWEQMGEPKKFALIELGPGRGTLMADLLRGTKKFHNFAKAVSVHLVECSPTLRKLQEQTVQVDSEVQGSNEERSQVSGVPVSWHLDLDQVPRGSVLTSTVFALDAVPSIIIAHEFFDALPIHQFQKTDRGWCEKLVDVSETSSGDLRFVLSPHPTVASRLYLPKRLKWASENERSSLQHVEVCPQALKLTAEIARRVGEDGGGALLIDYGEDKLVSDSLQAIRQHQFVDVLDNPGGADLSAYVDFAAIRQVVAEAAVGATAYGPITQSLFLGLMGINFRLDKLLEVSSDKQADSLQLGYWQLVGDGPAQWLEEEDQISPKEDEESNRRDQKEDEQSIPRDQPLGMGYRYKVLAIVQTKLGPPAAFH